MVNNGLQIPNPLVKTCLVYAELCIDSVLTAAGRNLRATLLLTCVTSLCRFSVACVGTMASCGGGVIINMLRHLRVSRASVSISSFRLQFD